MGAKGRVTSLLAKRDLVLAAAIEQVSSKLGTEAAPSAAPSAAAAAGGHLRCALHLCNKKFVGSAGVLAGLQLVSGSQ